MKRQKNTTQMKEQTRNTGVQINWGNRQTIWKRIQNNDSKNDQKPWKQKLISDQWQLQNQENNN